MVSLWDGVISPPGTFDDYTQGCRCTVQRAYLSTDKNIGQRSFHCDTVYSRVCSDKYMNGMACGETFERIHIKHFTPGTI